MKNRNITFRIILCMLVCLAVLPKARAVSPAPDGCYPNFTTAEGCDALNSLNTGAGNTGLGWRSLFLDSTGSFNTAVGGGALALNNGDSNTAVGAAALLLNTTGSGNTAVGTNALVYNTTGNTNTATGQNALFNNTTGNANTAIGGGALPNNTTGNNNTANGESALSGNSTGNNNTANGESALLSNTTGGANTATGESALLRNTTGGANTATGESALFGNNTGSFNTANGRSALLNNTTGNANTAIGEGALPNNTAGGSNTALGVNAGAGVTTANDVICIGADVDGENVSNTCYIGNIFGVTSVGIGVLVNSAGKLGTTTSSRRFKDGIKPMDRSSEALFALKPVTFHYKMEIDPVGTSQFGLVAEEVEKVNSDLVVRDQEGKPYSVRYDAVNAMLLNEFLKEHKKVEEQQTEMENQQATIGELKATVTQQQKSFETKLAEQHKQIEALTSGLQKISVRLEASEPAQKVACLPVVPLREGGNKP